MKTRTFRLEKLVHDEIVQGHIDEGGAVDYEVLGDEAWIQALEDKLMEEQAELAAAKYEKEKAKERQDIQNIQFALGRINDDEFQPTKTFNKNTIFIR